MQDPGSSVDENSEWRDTMIANDEATATRNKLIAVTEHLPVIFFGSASEPRSARPLRVAASDVTLRDGRASVFPANPPPHRGGTTDDFRLTFTDKTFMMLVNLSPDELRPRNPADGPAGDICTNDLQELPR